MQIMEHGSSGRHGVPRRKSRFAPRGSKIHHIRTKSSEILQRFNLPRDDCCTAESGSHRSPETGTWEGGLTSKRRKNSLDLSVSSPILDGLEGHPRHNFCTFSTVAENPPTTAFLEQESPMDIDTRFESNNCADSSAFNEVIPGGSQRIADSTNPGSRSPEKSHVKTPSSPLFDPSILAAFEEAIESVRCSDLDDTWMLDSDNSNEPSSFSSGKFTWNSSEASSDEENGGRSNELFGNALDDSSHVGFPREIGDQVKRQKIDIAYTGLQQFELRCPPKGEDKVVLYFTSMRGVRRTYKDCCTLRNILQGLHVEVDERDVWMHCKFKEELADLLGEWAFPVPRLFIKGRYIGGIEEVEQLNDDGVLTKLVEDLPKLGKSRKTCEGCADVRFIPCLTCSGSRKHLDDEIDKIVPCFECNENGLIMCPLCRK
ncbi:hypothetical protein KP509_01G031400 [Ceratopteris richardii]|nr:hypothetical protein KP509_01G031400 [Ceratopteris richardii]